MITKDEKKYIANLAESGVSAVEITQAIFIRRGPMMYARLCEEITNYLDTSNLWEKEERIKEIEDNRK